MPLGILKSYLPWILYFLISSASFLNIELAPLTAIAATVLFGWDELRKKFLLAWLSLTYFLILAFLYLFPSLHPWLNQYASMVSTWTLASIMWISILIGQPFTLQYAREKVEEVYWKSPTFLKINNWISFVWASCLTLIALNGILAPYLHLAINWLNDIITIALTLFALWFTEKFPDWYQGRLFKKYSRHHEDPKENPFLQGNYAPIHEEVSGCHLPVRGRIPSELTGIYMRNGPNPAFPPISYTYPIDGDGMLHAIYLLDGEASYRNRYVLTKGLLAERRAGKALYGGIANPIPPDPKLIGKDGDPGPIKNGAFIHIIRHANQYLALLEATPAYEVTAQLETIKEWHPKNVDSTFNINAHTRLDPSTGELYTATYDVTAPYLCFNIINNQGQLQKSIPVDKPYPTMLHDFALTKNYIVFFDCPAVLDIKALETGEALLQWKPEYGVNIGIINRNTQKIQWLKTEAFFVFHFANAFEDADKIIVDYIQHPKLELGKNLYTDAPPQLYRATLDLKNQKITRRPLSSQIVEFPRINDHFMTQNNRYIYMPTKLHAKATEFHALMKYDSITQETIFHDFGIDAEIGEAVFAPAHAHSLVEDDGYLMLYVYHRGENRSDFVILAAEELTAEPVATVRLPQRVPHGLHGSWMQGLWW